MTTATLDQPKKKHRWHLLAGEHLQNETRRLADGQDHIVEVKYSANDATRCILESEVDLEARFNQPGCEKFRRLPDVGQEATALAANIPDDAFRQECIRRGIIKDEAVPIDPGSITPHLANVPKPVPSTSQTASPRQAHPALLNLKTMPLVGLQKLAEDEEIDLSQCKNEQQTRDAVRKALEARSK